MLYLPRATGVRRVFNCYVFNIKVLKCISNISNLFCSKPSAPKAEHGELGPELR